MHLPVLFHEVMMVLEPGPTKKYLDATFGRGGHSRGLLRSGAFVLALDRDPDAVAYASQDVFFASHPRFEIRKMNFGQIGSLATEEIFDGILLDLGVSSPQLDRGERGFSFQLDGPLDMRMDPSQGLTAADLVNTWSREELSALFRDFGGENRAWQVAGAICQAREIEPIKTTRQLAMVVERITKQRGRLHPATRVFQALRIEVNRELEALDGALEAAPKLLRKGGRLAVISFHELEDRRVKQFLERSSAEEIRVEGNPWGVPNPRRTMRKVGRWLPQASELAVNPRARSARLRVGERI